MKITARRVQCLLRRKHALSLIVNVDILRQYGNRLHRAHGCCGKITSCAALNGNDDHVCRKRLRARRRSCWTVENILTASLIGAVCGPRSGDGCSRNEPYSLKSIYMTTWLRPKSNGPDRHINLEMEMKPLDVALRRARCGNEVKDRL